MDGSALEVKLAVFEGPLELLLHLIQKHELDIFDIPIQFITERFIEGMVAMERLDLQVGGEFLVMAATLAHIKSRLLLPRAEPPPGSEAEGDDPRAELVDQLVAYQRYKELAAQLDGRGTLGRDVFARPGPERPASAVGEASYAERPLDLFQLIQAFEQVKRRAGFRRRLDVKVARRSVGQEMRRIAQLLTGRQLLDFWGLVEPDETGLPSVVSLVGAFLGLLELARRGLVRVHAGSGPGDLVIRPAVGDVLAQLAKNLGPGDTEGEPGA